MASNVLTDTELELIRAATLLNPDGPDPCFHDRARLVAEVDRLKERGHRVESVLAELVTSHAARLEKPDEGRIEREARAWDAARTHVINSMMEAG